MSKCFLLPHYHWGPSTDWYQKLFFWKITVFIIWYKFSNYVIKALYIVIKVISFIFVYK